MSPLAWARSQALAAESLAACSRRTATIFTRQRITTMARMAPKLKYSFLLIVIAKASPNRRGACRPAGGVYLLLVRSKPKFDRCGRLRSRGFITPFLHGIECRLNKYRMSADNLGALYTAVWSDHDL